MEKDKINKIIGIIKSLREDVGAMPTNNISGGKIAGSAAAGDDPPVRKEEKIYLSEGTKKNLDS